MRPTRNLSNGEGARYAVVSALHIAKFAPKIEDHIGFFRPKTFPAATEAASHGDANKKTKHTRPKPEGAASKTIPAEPSVSHGTPSVVPYEWFSEDRALVPQSGVRSRILVLWVNEDVLGDSSLQSLSSLVADLCPAGAKETCPRFHATIKFLGPYASTTLRAMATEMNNGDKAKKDGATSCPPNLKNLDVYAYGATYFPQDLDKDPVSALKGCINLYRTIAK